MELGARSGMHRSYIGGIERGERNVSYSNLLRLAAALSVDASGLVAHAERLRRRDASSRGNSGASATPRRQHGSGAVLRPARTGAAQRDASRGCSGQQGRTRHVSSSAATREDPARSAGDADAIDSDVETARKFI
jgi:hypothetical protein